MRVAVHYHTLVLKMLVTMLVSTSVQAQTFDNYVQRLSEHPQVESMLLESDALRAQAEGELGLPDPIFTIGIDNMPISDPAFDRFLPTSKVIGFSQSIPNPSLSAAKSERYEQMSEKQKLIAHYTNARLRFMLISKLAEYESVKTQKNLIKTQLNYYKELENTLKGQIESGRSVYQRFSEVDVERAEAERKLNDLDARIASVEAEFIRLINEVPNIKLPKILYLNWDQNPASLYPVVISGEDIDIAKKGVAVADAAFLPSYGVTAAYKQREDGENGTFAGDDWFSVQAKVSIPLWANSNQKPKLKAAKAREKSAQLAYNDTSLLWVKHMRTLQSKRDAAAKNIKVLQDKEWAMKKKVAAAERNYESGTQNLDSVLLAKIDRLNIQGQLTAVKEKYSSLSAEFNSNIIDLDENTTLKEVSE